MGALQHAYMHKLVFLLSFFWISCLLSQEEKRLFSLEEALAIALENNKEILSLEELIEAAKQRRIQSIADFLPSAEFTANYYWTEEEFLLNPQSITSTIASITSFQQLATLKIPLQNEFYDSGFNFRQLLFSKEIYHKIKKGTLDVIDVEIELKRVTNELIYQVRTAYYLNVVAQDEVTVQEEIVKNLLEAWRQEEIRQQGGKSLPYDTQQSQVAYMNALTDLYQAQKNLKSARNRLLQVLGIISEGEQITYVPIEKEMPIQAIPALADKLSQLKTTPKFNSGPLFESEEISWWQEQAFFFRPEIQKQENAVNIQNETVKMRQGLYYPTLQAVAKYRTEWFPAAKFDQQDYSWLWGFELRWNLFDGFGRESRICEAHYNKKSALWDYWRSVESAQVEVKDLFNEIEQGLMSYVAATEAKEVSSLSLHQAQDRLAAETITPLQYRDSTAAYLKARHNLNLAGYQLLKSYYGLRKAAGVDVLCD